MSTIMAQLHQDHINLSRLLGVLKTKLAGLKSGERPDYQLLLDAITYIIDYADAYHHPLEDIIYRYAEAQYPDQQAVLQEIEQEHVSIREASASFQLLTENILHDAIVPMDQYTERLESFIDQQFAHLNREEGRIFPMLDNAMTDNDWQSVMMQVTEQDDPLFGENVADEYKRLYRELMLESEVA